jgi:GNAT superfamily N-acetyltransferase
MKAGPRVVVRAAQPGEGAAVAALWRELWDAHERWGGYPGSHDARVYAHVAARLDQDARVRAGHPMLGRHAHFVADLGGVPCGQVEGWLDHLGTSRTSPLTCEVRSLIVGQSARGRGVGRALLDALAKAARDAAAPAPCILAAEVLEPNPAHAFYARVGYAPVSWSTRVEAPEGAVAPSSPVATRFATRQDATAIARLEATLATRRTALGDARFDRPSARGITMVATLSSHLGVDPMASPGDPATIVAVDATGVVLAAASVAVQALEPPFLPIRRGLVGRFALQPARPARPLVRALVAFGCRMAASYGAHYVELTDLSAPGTELYDAALTTGARPWSRVVTKLG